MMEFINNIVGVVKAAWNIFCMAPVTCILLAITFVGMAFCAYYFIKDVVCAKNGGPIILR